MNIPFKIVPNNTGGTVIPESAAAPVVVMPEEEKRLLISWKSPSRPFKKRDKDFFTTVTIMAILFIVILIFLREFLVVLVVMAFVFLVYVLATVPPEEIDNEVYTTGIKNGIHYYSYNELLYYWFENRYGNPMMVARTRARLPGNIYLLLSSKTREQVEEAIGTRLPLQETMENTWIDRAATWMQQKVPLEKSS